MCDIFLTREHIATTQSWVPIVMAAVSAASAIFGAAKSAQANKKNQGLLDQFGNENQSDYLKETYRGAIDNAGSKAYLKKLSNTIDDNTKSNENTAAATGATQENVLAAKQGNNRVVSDAISGLVEREDQRKLQVKQGYLQRKQQIASGQMGMNSQVGQNWANIGNNISGAAGSLAAAYMNGGSGASYSQQNPKRKSM